MPGFVVRASSLRLIALRKATIEFQPILVWAGQRIHCRFDHPDHDIHTGRARARRGTAGADCCVADNGDGGRRGKSHNWALHSGEKVIVDREATVEYIFNIYCWCVWNFPPLAHEQN